MIIISNIKYLLLHKPRSVIIIKKSKILFSLLSIILILSLFPATSYSDNDNDFEELLKSHSLPVVRIYADGFDSLYESHEKSTVIQGSFDFYDETDCLCFSSPCGISLSGNASLQMVKHKSLKVDFGKEYNGIQSINYDLFNIGITDYRSLILRAGTDAEYRVFNEVIWQDLALEMNPKIYTQHSRFCVAYINDNYYGMYIIKENIGPRSYASWKDVPKSSVEYFGPTKRTTTDYRDTFLSFIKSNDLSIDIVYKAACRMVNIDNLIDYLIIEGVSSNSDLYYNVKVFRSSKAENKWEYALFDLDAAMPKGYYCSAWKNLFFDDTHDYRLGLLFNSFMKNDDFREKFLKRYAEVCHDYLGNDKIVTKITEYETLISDEVDSSFRRWGSSGNTWRDNIKLWKDSTISIDYENRCIDNLNSIIQFSDEEWLFFNHYK